MRKVVFLLLLFAAASWLPASGQTLGEIVGIVTDSTGLVVPNASITVTNTATNTVRKAVTNETGLYTVPGLVPGPYSVRVEVPGFRTMTRNIELQVQQTARVDFTLQVGQVSEAIEVSGSAIMLTTENATVGTVIENRRIVELPLNGRNFLQLVSLSPNVTYDFSSPGQAAGRQGGTRAQQNISLMGMRGTWNRYTLDGIENTDVNFNLYIVLPSTEALQEFKVQSGIYPAEFGRAASQINVMTKSGTNQYHGSMFEFMRNSKLDARQYDFIGTVPSKTPFRWNQYGFTLSGPVQIPKVFNGRDRLFFMSNFEGFRERRTTKGTYTVPTVAMRNGDFSYQLAQGNQLYDQASRVKANGVVTASPYPGNQIPSSRFSPISLKLLEFWPEPNVPTTVLKDNYQKNNRSLTDKDQFTQRIDFNESSTSQWFGRFSWTDESSLNEALKLNGTTLYTRARQYMLSNTRTLSPTAINEFRFGVNDFFNAIAQELSNKRDVLKELGIPGLTSPDSLSWGIPRITSLVGVSGFGNDSSGPFAINDAIFQWIDNFSLLRGKHSFRFGGEVRRDRYNQRGNEFSRGSFEFNGQYSSNPATRKGGDSTADLLVGALSRAESTIATAFAQFRATSMYYYFDDTYRMTPKLTVNYGLRYELTPPWYDRSQNMVSVHVPYIFEVANVPDLTKHPVLVRTGRGDFYEGKDFRYPGVPVARDGRLGDRLIGTDTNDFAPRLGIAYSPSEKWTFRTGFGVFYSVESSNSRFDLNRGLSGRVTRQGDPDVWDIRYDNFLTGAAKPWILPPAPFLWSVKYNVRTTYSMQYLFNIQRELSKDTVLEVGYNASLSRRVQSLQDPNAPLPGPGSTSSRVPYPEFGIIQTVHSEGIANYHGMGLKVSRRMSQGLTYMLSYTWSKSLDTASAIRGTGADIFPQNNYCLRCDKGYSAFNTPHRYVTSLLYELPFGKGRRYANRGGIVDGIIGGWQIGSIFTIQSGRPLNMTASGFNSSNTNKYGEVRQSSKGMDPYLPAGERNANQWFNKAALGPAPLYEFGNISRNRLMGPTTFQWDFSTHKNFRIMEGHELQFRFEAFNFPNHPSLGNPNTEWGSRDPVNPGPTFGTIRSTAYRMRELQFALKYSF